MLYYSDFEQDTLNRTAVKLMTEVIADMQAYELRITENINQLRTDYKLVDKQGADLRWKRISDVMPSIKVAEMLTRLKKMYDDDVLTEEEYEGIMNSTSIEFMQTFLLVAFDDMYLDLYNLSIQKGSKSDLKLTVKPATTSSSLVEETMEGSSNQSSISDRIDEEFVEKLGELLHRDSVLYIKVGTLRHYIRSPKSEVELVKSIKSGDSGALSKITTSPYKGIIAGFSEYLHDKSMRIIDDRDVENNSKNLIRLPKFLMTQYFSHAGKTIFANYMRSTNRLTDSEGNQVAMNEIKDFNYTSKEEVIDFKGVMIILNKFATKYMSRGGDILTDPIQWRKERLLPSIAHAMNTSLKTGIPVDVDLDKPMKAMNTKDTSFVTFPLTNVYTKTSSGGVPKTVDISLTPTVVDAEVTKRLKRIYDMLDVVNEYYGNVDTVNFHSVRDALIEIDKEATSYRKATDMISGSAYKGSDPAYMAGKEYHEIDEFINSLFEVVDAVKQLEKQLSQFGMNILMFPNQIVREHQMIAQYSSLKVYLRYSDRYKVDTITERKMLDYFQAPPGNIYEKDEITRRKFVRAKVAQEKATLTDEQIFEISKYQRFELSQIKKSALEDLVETKEHEVRPKTEEVIELVKSTISKVDKKTVPFTADQLKLTLPQLFEPKSVILKKYNHMDYSEFMYHSLETLIDDPKAMSDSLGVWFRSVAVIAGAFNPNCNTPEEFARRLKTYTTVPDALEPYLGALYNAFYSVIMFRGYKSVQSIDNDLADQHLRKVLAKDIVRHLCSYHFFVTYDENRYGVDEEGEPLAEVVVPHSELYTQLDMDINALTNGLSYAIYFDVSYIAKFNSLMLRTYTQEWYDINASSLDPSNPITKPTNYIHRALVFVTMNELYKNMRGYLKLLEDSLTDLTQRRVWDSESDQYYKVKNYSMYDMLHSYSSMSGYIDLAKQLDREVTKLYQESGIGTHTIKSVKRILQNDSIMFTAYKLPLEENQTSHQLDIVNYKTALLTVRNLFPYELSSRLLTLDKQFKSMKARLEAKLGNNSYRKYESEQQFNKYRGLLEELDKEITNNSNPHQFTLTDNSSSPLISAIMQDKTYDTFGYVKNKHGYLMGQDSTTISFLHYKGLIVTISTMAESIAVVASDQDYSQTVIEATSDEKKKSKSRNISMQRIDTVDLQSPEYSWLLVY